LLDPQGREHEEHGHRETPASTRPSAITGKMSR
jgi:hypothetical protein